MKLLKTLGLTVAVAASGAAQAAPELLLQYDTFGSTASMTPFFENSAVSGDNLVMGPGLTPNTFSTFNSFGWDTASTSFSDAVAAGDYWTFGFDANTAISLTTFDVRLDRSGTGPDDFEIYASVNEGPGTLVLAHDYQDSGAAVEFLGIDLSSISLSSGDSLVFTLAAFNSESENGTFDLETLSFPGDDALLIYGEVAPVPLPAAAWLFLSGVAGLAAYSRKRTA